MKKVIQIALSIALALSITTAASAQFVPTKSTKSTVSEVRDGVTYWIHNVVKGETLYSLSKLYEISIDEMVKDNEQLKEGLKEGQKLYIKANERELTKERIATEQTERVVTEERVRAAEEDSLSDDSYRLLANHRVRWYETLQSISKKYGVKPEEIEYVNKLKEGKAVTRQVLKIPYPGTLKMAIREDRIDPTEVTERQVATTKIDTINLEIAKRDSLKIEPEKTFVEKLREAFVPKSKYRKIKAKLLLPLSDTTEVERDGTTIVERNSNLDFYQGFLLALNQIKESEPTIKIELDVIDLATEQLDDVIRGGTLEQSDIIFGPIDRAHLEILLRSGVASNSIVVSPLDPGSDYLAGEFQNFFQVSTPIHYQQREILSMINYLFDLLIIWEKGASEQLVHETRELLDSAEISYNELSYTLLEGRNIPPILKDLLQSSTINHVVVLSESEAFIADAIRNLNVVTSERKVKVKLYGQPRWSSYKNLDVNLFHSMNLTVPTQYWVDYGDYEVNQFISKYRALYMREPSPYAFQAYDIATYFFTNMWREGSSFAKEGATKESSHLQSHFRFVKEGESGGYINRAMRKVEYHSDFTISFK